MSKLTLEQAKQKLKALQLQSSGGVEGFHLGRVGFRKHTKKYLSSIDRSINRVLEIGRLREFIKSEEQKELRRTEPIKPSIYIEDITQIEVGKRYRHVFLGTVMVIKINKSTIKVVTDSGYSENSKPNYFYKSA